MVRNLIVGSGFSAALVKAYLDSNDVDIVSPNFINDPRGNLLLNMSNALQCDKPIGKKSKTFSMLKVNDNNKVKLHNRVIHGGNSTIWGGFYDNSKNIDKIRYLDKIGAIPVQLSYRDTGSVSNSLSIYQLQDANGFIYNSFNYLKDRVENCFLLKIITKKDSVLTEQFSIEENKILYKEYQNIYVCCGVINTIALLNHSFGVKKYKLSDFAHNIRVCNLYSKMPDLDNRLVIRYNLIRAVNHYLGYQKNIKINSPNFILGIEQIFSKDKIYLDITVDNEIMKFYTSAIEFGSSIHYSNLEVDGLTLNNFISLFSNRVKFFGMSSIEEYQPGPISSAIHDTIHCYFNKED